MIEQVFLSRQVKQSVIIGNNLVYYYLYWYIKKLVDY